MDAVFILILGTKFCIGQGPIRQERLGGDRKIDTFVTRI